MSREKKTKNYMATRYTNIKKPCKLLFNVAGNVLYFLAKLKYGIRVFREEGLKMQQPFVLLGNHASNLDFLFLIFGAYPYYLNIVTSDFYCRSPLLRLITHLGGCIPISQFSVDYTATKKILETVKNGGNIGIFPSGQSSFSGAGTSIYYSIAKLLKILGINVYVSHIDGSHLAFPKWDMRSFRQSRIEVRVKALFDKAEVQAMAEEDIYAKVVEELQFDDYEWQRGKMLGGGKMRKAEGLEHVLFLCPACKTEFSTVAEKNTLYCKKCNMKATMDNYGFLSFTDHALTTQFDTPVKWFNWQKQHYSAILKESMPYEQDAGLFEVIARGRMKKIADGVAVLRHNSLEFCGNNGRKYVSDDFSSYDFAHEKTNFFEIIFDKKLYAIFPTIASSVFKFSILKEALYHAAARKR